MHDVILSIMALKVRGACYEDQASEKHIVTPDIVNRKD